MTPGANAFVRMSAGKLIVLDSSCSAGRIGGRVSAMGKAVSRCHQGHYYKTNIETATERFNRVIETAPRSEAPRDRDRPGAFAPRMIETAQESVARHATRFQIADSELDCLHGRN